MNTLKGAPKTPVDSDLLGLLMPFAESLESGIDKTQALIAADRADELELTSCAWLLRYFGSIEFDKTMLFTGSRRYGTPKPSSDLDLVILISSMSRFPIEQSCDFNDRTEYHLCYPTRQRRRRRGEMQPPGIDAALRFGPINLLCVHMTHQMKAWVDGTNILLKEAPVTRDRAVEVFQAQRKKYLDDLLDQEVGF